MGGCEGLPATKVCSFSLDPGSSGQKVRIHITECRRRYLNQSTGIAQKEPRNFPSPECVSVCKCVCDHQRSYVYLYVVVFKSMCVCVTDKHTE